MQQNSSQGSARGCALCGKTESLCVCSSCPSLTPRTRVLILQHPQEPDKELGSAVILHRSLTNSVIKVGLSWRNLSHALGEPTEHGNWGVLFLGTQAKSKPALSDTERVTILTKRGAPTKELPQGIVVLDGNWRQAKAMWWRNSWLLKLKRIVLSPAAPSLYGSLRKEPRRESVSTLEAVAMTLSFLEGDPDIEEQLLIPFKELLHKYRKRRA